MSILTIIKRPIVTEKSTIAAEAGIYTFEVDRTASKIDVKGAIEKAFKVKVQRVRTAVCRDRMRRKGQTVSRIRYWKKAIVQLQPGQKISVFEGA